MNAGFGWDMGPFEKWGALGVEVTVKAMEAWATNLHNGYMICCFKVPKAFYKVEDGINASIMISPVKNLQNNPGY
jgi:3-hydroxyacyl-CoA dehydrogenase